MEMIQRPMIEKIRFEGVSFAHENQDAILKNCDFEFPSDQVLLVKAVEGSGKSTLMQLLAGLLIPQSGSYLLNDQDVSAMSFEEFLPFRLQIGFTFDYGGLISNRTVFDNLVLPLVYHKMLSETEARARVNRLIERFDIGKFKGERPASIPGRVRKLAVLLRALVIHPQILLLDDPSVGLGESTQHLFADVVNELRAEGFARHVIITSYDQKFMDLMPHHTIHMAEGLLYLQPAEATGRAAL